MTTALIFPGQGSQAVGMAKTLADNFPIAQHTLQEVDDALSQHLSTLMFEGPEDELTLTHNAQPAIMAASMAALRVMEKETGFSIAQDSSYVAGHSLGEYSALTAAYSLPLSTTAKLLRIRGEAMQQAVPAGKGSMAAIIGLTLEDVRTIAHSAHEGSEVCEIANDNSAQQIVISGTIGGIEKAIELAKDKGAKRALPLAVSAPFHSSLMQPAAERMAEALLDTIIEEPLIPLIANVTAEAVSAPDMIKHLLVEQVTAKVRWRESVHYMKDQGVTRMIEIGHGKVLSGLVRRIEPDMQCTNIASPEDIEKLAAVA